MRHQKRRRSRRLRKKLRLDEFKTFGFEIALTLQAGLSDQAIDQFWDDFIGDAIEANDLSFGGLYTGYICPNARLSASATAAMCERVRLWCTARPDVQAVSMGPVIDDNPPVPPDLYPLTLDT